VSQPDFEINASLRALRLTVIVAPDARVEGQDATLERQRAVASEFLNDQVANADVAVEKKVVGRLSNDR
jgi:hypothetical protein